MDIQFTTKAQEALGASVRIAAANGNPQVEPIHLLDSLLADGPGNRDHAARRRRCGHRGAYAEARAKVEALPSAQGSSVAQPNLNQPALKVLNAAQSLAKERGDEYVSTEHLLIALSQDGGPGVSDMLASAGSNRTGAPRSTAGSSGVGSRDNPRIRRAPSRRWRSSASTSPRGARGQDRSGHRPRRGDPAHHPGAVAAHEEQPGADR
jgi:ATP-dependent Clp protease ATP-binding subunit ClpA